MAKISRGDVVIAKVPQQDNTAKARPVVVVQNDTNNARLTNVIVAMITSNTGLASKEATQVFIDVATPDGQQTGRVHSSAVKCENIYTLPSRVMRKIGVMPDALLPQVDDALRASLAL
jgi:mRNA interferase MazF